MLPDIHALKSKRTFLRPAQISRHLYCCICHEVFEDPVRTLCGHTFCYICIMQWKNIKMSCPVCKKGIRARNLEKDLLACAFVDEIEVKCFHGGCSWEGVEAVRSKHQRCCQFKPKNQEMSISSNIDYIDVNANYCELEQSCEESQVEILPSHTL